MNKEIIQTLDKILPVVERVHGDHHPELHRVAQLYAQLRNAPRRRAFRAASRGVRKLRRPGGRVSDL